jgi:hypothetical protein
MMTINEAIIQLAQCHTSEDLHSILSALRGPDDVRDVPVDYEVWDNEENCFCKTDYIKKKFTLPIREAALGPAFEGWDSWPPCSATGRINASELEAFRHYAGHYFEHVRLAALALGIYDEHAEENDEW